MITLQFKRMDGCKVQSNTITCLSEINAHMHKIGVNVEPFDVAAEIADRNIADKIINNTATHDEILAALEVKSKAAFMKIIQAGQRKPMYAVDDMHLATAEEGVAPYPKIYDLDQCTQRDKAFLVNKFARLHFNCYQGGDAHGVDESMTPMSVDERMLLLPRAEQSDIPWFWFFYMGDGVVAKLTLAPGESIGINMSYPGLWPHGAYFGARKGMCHAQIACGNPVWHLRYGMTYSGADSTAKAFPNNSNGVKPDFSKVLGHNPWCDFSGYDKDDGVIPAILDE